MAGGAGNQRDGMISGINMTPLVDIMLVLLIIFLVTARVTAQPQALPLDLPRSESGGGVQVVLAIELGREGAIAVDGKRIEGDDALLPLAKAQLAAHPGLRAVLQVDGEVKHARVIHTLDLLTRAGVDKVAFGVTLEHHDGAHP